MATYRKEYPQEALLKERAYREANRERLRAKDRASYAANHERHLARRSRYCKRNAEKLRVRAAEYYSTHKVVINERVKRRYHEDPYYSICTRLRASLSQAMRRNGKKSAPTAVLLGCSIEDFLKHLEAQFALAGPHPKTGEPMSWQNRRMWHIDHIIPCCAFENLATDALQQRRCYHFLNLRPLWKEQNLSKGARIPGFRRERTKRISGPAANRREES